MTRREKETRIVVTGEASATARVRSALESVVVGDAAVEAIRLMQSAINTLQRGRTFGRRLR